MGNKMKKWKLSKRAKESIKNLISSKDSEKVGYIAAVDPQTGEVFYGKTVVEAAKEGRKVKSDPKATFFFVRVGYHSVHVLKSINLQGYIDQYYLPKIKGYVHNRNLHFISSIPDHIYSTFRFYSGYRFFRFYCVRHKNYTKY